MQQLCIEYFYPLTEQMDLNLDYKPCNEFEEQKRKAWIANSVIGGTGTYLMSGSNGVGLTWASINATDTSFNIMPEGSVGYWLISSNTKLHRKERPNWLHQKMTKVFFGWKWEDK